MEIHFDKGFFAHRLRIKQLALHLTVTQAAKEIGISKSQLSRLNRELCIPDVVTYAKCCLWLGLGQHYFIKEINKPWKQKKNQ